MDKYSTSLFFVRTGGSAKANETYFPSFSSKNAAAATEDGQKTQKSVFLQKLRSGKASAALTLKRNLTLKRKYIVDSLGSIWGENQV